MHKFFLLLTGVAIAAGGCLPAAAQSLDPTFGPVGIYKPGLVYSAVEQPDGKRLVAGDFVRVNGTAAPTLTRLSAAGVVDAAFQQNLGATAQAYRPRLLPNGQVLVISIGGPLTAGGLTRQSVLRLNADGTGDASFDAGTGATYNGSPIFIDDLLPLPNGQLLVVGPFDHFNGVAARRIVRLTATGSVDPTFNPGTSTNGEIETVVGLPNGQLLIGGIFPSFDGHPANGLARLNANGSFDATFGTNFDSDSEATNLIVQPDGKLLVAGGLLFNTNPQGVGLVRLLPSGALDTSFTPPAALAGYTSYSLFGDAIQLQADGKILVLGAAPGAGVIRLNANGTPDASFQAGSTNALPYSLTLLANGQLLVGGAFTTFDGVVNRPLVQLTSTGALNPAFQPLMQAPGTLNAVVRQPDGKLLVGGYFTEVNGQAAQGVARFTTTGTLDASFALSASTQRFAVADLALQPDGRVLAAGENTVVRYLPTGAPDNTFNGYVSTSGRPSQLLLQPNGSLLVGYGNSVAPTPVARLLANGAADASFTPLATGPGSLATVQALTLQPDGKVLAAGSFRPASGGAAIATVVRLTAAGAVDASFAGSEFAGTTPTAGLKKLVLQSDGKLLVGGNFSAYGSAPRAGVARLNADGPLDAGFVPPALTGPVNTLGLQPNSRVLLGGSFTGPGLPANLARLLPTGQADASFGATAVPNNAVTALLVQPDGGLVVGGSFTAVSGQPYPALVRITATNVLTVAAPQAVADRTEVWPVPAHATLYVAPAPGTQAQRLELLDVVGRPVRAQPVAPGTTAVPVQGLAAGTYLLRLTYAEGVVVRRVQVQ